MARSLYSCMTRKLRLHRLYKGGVEVNQGIRSLQTLTTVFVLVGRLSSSDYLRILLALIFHETLSLQSVGIDELIPRHFATRRALYLSTVPSAYFFGFRIPCCSLVRCG